MFSASYLLFVNTILNKRCQSVIIYAFVDNVLELILDHFQAYKRLDDDRGKCYELGQSVVAGMRGVLAAWMKQSQQLETWKHNQNIKFALHSVVSLHGAGTTLDHTQYNHLQVSKLN